MSIGFNPLISLGFFKGQNSKFESSSETIFPTIFISYDINLRCLTVNTSFSM